MPGYNPDLGKQYEFNPAKAKQLLAEAGYANVSSLPQMRYQYGDTPANALIAEFIQQQLKDNLGINLSLEPMAPKDFNDLVSSKQYTCAWFGWAADYPDPDDWLPEVYATDGTGNRSSYSNPEFDRIANQAMIELNTTRRLQLWSDAHEIVVEDVPIAFMLNRERFVLVKPSIRGSLKNTGMDGAVAGDMCFSEVYKSQ